MPRSYLLALAVLLASTTVGAQTPAAPGRLSVRWEELTAAAFVTAIRRAQGTCLLPFGIMEKHGPHLPLGSDLINVRYASLNAAQQEYAVVFPEHYVGQIFEAKHEPGTVAYSRGLQLQMLQETSDEMARNGCKKIIIVNGHGARRESGADQTHLKLPQGLYTGFWWYARFPHHYAGEGAVASRELGEFAAKTWIDAIVESIRAVKADQESLQLQNEFFERSKRPLYAPR